MRGIIQDLSPKYKHYETHEQTVCSVANSRKFDATFFVVLTLRKCDPFRSARNLHYHCCCRSKRGRQCDGKELQTLLAYV